MDLDTLLAELNKYKQQVFDCQHCERYTQCMEIDIPCHCLVLLRQICNYLDDGDELKRLIKGCVFGEGDGYCNGGCMFYEKKYRCIQYMLSEAYDRLATWAVN